MKWKIRNLPKSSPVTAKDYGYFSCKIGNVSDGVDDDDEKNLPSP